MLRWQATYPVTVFRSALNSRHSEKQGWFALCDDRSNLSFSGENQTRLLPLKQVACHKLPSKQWVAMTQSRLLPVFHAPHQAPQKKQKLMYDKSICKGLNFYKTMIL